MDEKALGIVISYVCLNRAPNYSKDLLLDRLREATPGDRINISVRSPFRSGKCLGNMSSVEDVNETIGYWKAVSFRHLLTFISSTLELVASLTFIPKFML